MDNKNNMYLMLDTCILSLTMDHAAVKTIHYEREKIAYIEIMIEGRLWSYAWLKDLMVAEIWGSFNGG